MQRVSWCKPVNLFYADGSECSNRKTNAKQKFANATFTCIELTTYIGGAIYQPAV